MKGLTDIPGIRVGHISDFDAVKEAAGIKTDICSYLLGGTSYAMEQARKEALTADSDCQRPLDTLEDQRTWLEKIRQSLDDETFYQLLYERDLLRVHKGSLTMAAAMKNDATLRGLPAIDIYRYQRTFYDRQNDIFEKMTGLRKDDLKKEAAWRKARAAELDQEKGEFSSCTMPQ